MNAYTVVGPTKRKPRRFKSLLERSGFGRARGELLERVVVRHAWCAVDESPDVLIEAAELLLHGDHARALLIGGLDLAPVPHDRRIRDEALDVALGELRHGVWIEPGERGSVALALAQDGGPAQPGLRTFEREQLEEAAVVVLGNTPLGVVVLDHERVGARPRTARAIRSSSPEPKLR